MSKLYVIDAFKFGFKSTFKNFKFLSLLSLLSIAIFIGGLIASVLVAGIFFIPLYMVQAQIKAMVMKVVALDVFSNVAKGVGDFAAQKAEIAANAWKDVLTQIVQKYPHVLVSAIIGIKILIVLALLVIIYLTLGFIRASINIYDGKENSFKVLRSDIKQVLRALCIGLIGIVIFIFPIILSVLLIAYYKYVVTGAVLLVLSVISMFYFGFKFAFSQWFLVDKNTKAIESMRLSFRLKYIFSNIILLSFLLSVVYLPVNIILEALTKASIGTPGFFLIGLLVFVAKTIYSIISILSMTYIYRRLSQKSLEQN